MGCEGGESARQGSQVGLGQQEQDGERLDLEKSEREGERLNFHIQALRFISTGGRGGFQKEMKRV